MIRNPAVPQRPTTPRCRRMSTPKPLPRATSVVVLGGVRSSGSMPKQPSAAAAPATRNVLRKPMRSTSTPPTAGPTRNENRIDPPIRAMARPLRPIATELVRWVCRESMTPMAATPTRSCRPTRRPTDPVNPIDATATPIRRSDTTATRPWPRRCVRAPARTAPPIAPPPAAPRTRLVAAIPTP